MRFCSPATTLAFVILALAAFAQAAVLSTTSTLGKRMNSGEGSSHQGAKLTYADLAAGQFQHEKGTLKQHPNNLFSVYDGKLFSHGKPMFVYKDEKQTFPLYKLRQAVADFGGFHARMQEQATALTFQVEKTTGLVGNPSINEGVTNHIRDIDHTRRTFGTNVGLLANGFNVRAFAKPTSGKGLKNWFGKSTPKATSWPKVHKLPPESVTDSLETMRRKLGDKRAIRFTTDDRSLSLGIRAFGEGQFEHQLLNTVSGALKFQHIHNFVP